MKKSFAPEKKKKNDVVFVMCILRLNDNQVKKQVDDFGEVLDDLSSDDDWITEGEKPDGSSNFDLLGIIDSATRRKNGTEDECNDEEIFNDVEMESHDIKDDLEIQNDINPDNSRSFKLNIVDYTGVAIGINSSTNVHNISAGTSSSSNNNLLDDDDLDESLRKNKEDKSNKASFSFHDTPTECLF
jgi:hypothetical protein